MGVDYINVTNTYNSHTINFSGTFHNMQNGRHREPLFKVRRASEDDLKVGGLPDNILCSSDAVRNRWTLIRSNQTGKTLSMMVQDLMIYLQTPIRHSMGKMCRGFMILMR